MTLFFEQGSIFNSPARILVNPVNCVGVMGAGLAKEFAYRYPPYFKDYKQQCADEKISIGESLHYHPGGGKIIVSFPTKLHWKDPSKLGYIEAGLEQLELLLKTFPVSSNVALPALGCGLGGLKYPDVLQLITEFSSRVKNNVYLYTFTRR